jgi:hypothetical protein
VRLKVNVPIEHHYQSIGQLAVDLAGGEPAKLLVYAEVEDGVVSASVLHSRVAGGVRFRLAPDELQDEIYSFWEAWAQDPANRDWRIMSYVAEAGKLKIDLLYPDQVDPEESRISRRSAAIRRYFGDAPVDYSSP